MTNWKYVKPIKGSTVLNKLEEELGIKFPKSYVDCATLNNGGRPPKNKVNDNLTMRSLVRIDELAELNVSETLKTIKDRLPSRIIPFADDSFGNYFCFDFSQANEPSIVFWDHEEKTDKALMLVSDSFDNFIARIAMVKQDALFDTKLQSMRS